MSRSSPASSAASARPWPTADRQLVLLLAQASQRRGALDDYLTRQHVDGVLLLSLHDDDELPDRIRAHGVPVVVGGRLGDANDDFVDVDNVQGAQLAVAHLAGLGRRHIATIAGPADMVAGRSRFEGYVAGLVEADLSVDDRLVARGDFTQSSGERSMRALLARGIEIDAVFCANDLMAVGALSALRKAGLRVPEDVAVVGFDDAPIALSTLPTLTTVHQSPEPMGRQMVAMLLDATRTPGVAQPGRMLSTHLVVRGSA